MAEGNEDGNRWCRAGGVHVNAHQHCVHVRCVMAWFLQRAQDNLAFRPGLADNELTTKSYLHFIHVLFIVPLTAVPVYTARLPCPHIRIGASLPPVRCSRPSCACFVPDDALQSFALDTCPNAAIPRQQLSAFTPTSCSELCPPHWFIVRAPCCATNRRPCGAPTTRKSSTTTRTPGSSSFPCVSRNLSWGTRTLQ